jgi:hypothetical protein
LIPTQQACARPPLPMWGAAAWVSFGEAAVFMPELKPSLLPLPLSAMFVSARWYAGGLWASCPRPLYTELFCYIMRKLLLLPMPFQGPLRVVVYSVFGVGAEIPNSAPRLTWDRSTTDNIRTTPRHERGRRVGTLKCLLIRCVSRRKWLIGQRPSLLLLGSFYLIHSG